MVKNMPDSLVQSLFFFLRVRRACNRARVRVPHGARKARTRGSEGSRRGNCRACLPAVYVIFGVCVYVCRVASLSLRQKTMMQFLRGSIVSPMYSTETEEHARIETTSGQAVRGLGGGGGVGGRGGDRRFLYIDS